MLLGLQGKQPDKCTESLSDDADISSCVEEQEQVVVVLRRCDVSSSLAKVSRQTFFLSSLKV